MPTTATCWVALWKDNSCPLLLDKGTSSKIMFRTFKSPPKFRLSVKCFWRPRPFVTASVAVILLSCHTGIVRLAFPEAVFLRLPLVERTGVSLQRAPFRSSAHTWLARKGKGIIRTLTETAILHRAAFSMDVHASNLET